MRKLLSIVGSLALASTIFASVSQTQPQGRSMNWGLQVGAYLPVDSEIRDTFGDALIRVGIAPINNKFGRSFAIRPDLGIMYAKNDDAKLLLVPLTLNVVVGFGQGQNMSYVSAGAGPAYYDYRLYRVTPGPTLTEYDDSGLTWNVNVEAGLQLGSRLSLVGRYDWYPQKDDFDFSGFSLSLNYAIFRW
jgi:hypothetical protein